MKVIGILGSPRENGNTASLLDAVLNAAAQAGAECERLNLTGLELNFCIACGHCYKTGQCIYEDGVAMVQANMMDADGIVLASPNYIHGVTAQLKTLMDRSSLHVHCFLFTGKYGASVATAGGGGEEVVAAFANQYLQACGAQTVGTVGAQGAGMGALVDQEAALARAAALGRDLVAAIAEKRQYPDQLAAHAAFADRMKQLVLHMGDQAPFQLAHWRKMGWL